MTARFFGFILTLLFVGQYVFSQPVIFTIHLSKKAQTIENIGASGAWFSEGIGKYWSSGKKERMVEQKEWMELMGKI